MFLKKLSISNGPTPIREIFFQKGLNLVVDETGTGDRRESGNNVGKTTTLRLIDYCFGGDGKNIYSDPEFKEKTDVQVETFLTQNNIIIELVLVDDLEQRGSREVVIRRNFLKRPDRILTINGASVTVGDFPRELKRLVFDSESEKPTFKQIISKNVRDERNRLANTLKVLNPYTRGDEYEALYLFWLGIEIDGDARKQQLVRARKLEQQLLDSLRRQTSLSQIEQSLIVVDRTVDELTKRRNAFEVSETYEADLNRLNLAKRRINELATHVSSLEMRRSLIIASRDELEADVSKVKPSLVRALYEEAKLLIPDLQKTFEETVAFHNQMVGKKMDFITKELPALEEELVKAKAEMTDELAVESRLASVLKKSGVIDELQAVFTDLGEAHERRGALEEQKRLWESATTRISEIDVQIDAIDASIDSKDDLLRKRIAAFNRYFSDLSSRLYGEQFILSSDWGDKGLELKISAIGGNLGTGKKRGQIAAFDLAYIQFADAEHIRCLHFVLQDQIENVHDNQITSLLTEIVGEVNCQYVLPVLRDKLPPDLDVEAYQVLCLSQSDKLFRI